MQLYLLTLWGYPDWADWAELSQELLRKSNTKKCF